MRLLKGIAMMSCLICVLSGCETTTTPPDVSSVQTTQQEQNQEKIQQSLQW